MGAQAAQIQAAAASAAQQQLGQAAGRGENESQQVRKSAHSHGEKMAFPATGWSYLDPKGKTQGPFTLLEMQQWNSLGYFKADLPMRCDPSDRFVPFCEL